MVRRKKDMDANRSAMLQRVANSEDAGSKKLQENAFMIRSLLGVTMFEKETGIRLLTPEARRTIVEWNHNNLHNIVFMSHQASSDVTMEDRLNISKDLLSDIKEKLLYTVRSPTVD